MSPPLQDSFARFTPDGRRARVAVATVAAVAAGGLLYATARMASSPLSGDPYTLFTWGLGVATVVVAAVAGAVLAAPESGTERSTPGAAAGEASVEAAKRRYAAGELTEEEFERRVETLVGVEAGEWTASRDADDSPEVESARN
ncbi:SHOCT domain-containing protein [Halobaculum sp. EA56]|uniref:SHOCT domain-containing protein n=1 Tax=Halobaculum sp. EA56 TaxID=3421648 RepID=UPI003EBB4554